MIGQFVPTYSEENAQFVPMSYVVFDGTIVSKQMGVVDSDLNSQVGLQGGIEQALEYMMSEISGQVGSVGTLESLLASVDGQLGGQVGSVGMYNFLAEVTADCTDILMVKPQSVMPSKGRKNQIVHTFEDGRESVAIVSDTSIFEVELQWEYVSDAERSTIMELFHNPTKANGSARSFYWLHPIDGYIYTVRFLTPLRTIYKHGLLIGIETIKLRIEGYFPIDELQFITFDGQMFLTANDEPFYVSGV